jgi:hypothetical protein
MHSEMLPSGSDSTMNSSFVSSATVHLPISLSVPSLVGCRPGSHGQDQVVLDHLSRVCWSKTSYAIHQSGDSPYMFCRP